MERKSLPSEFLRESSRNRFASWNEATTFAIDGAL